MLDLMKGNTTMRIGELLLKLGGVASGLVFVLLGTFRDLFAAADTTEESDRSIQDSDLIGDYNFRTQQFDSGTDPAGWYEDEP
jgi:hypothetical protein